MRNLTFYLMCCIAWCGATQSRAEAQTNGPRIDVSYLSDADQGWEKISKHRQVLGGEAGPMTLTEVSFREALAQLSEASGVTFAVNWDSFDRVGLAATRQLTYHAKKGTYADHLRGVLDIVGVDGFDEEKPEYSLTPAGVSIATRQEIRSPRVSRMYDVGALLRERFRPVGELSPEDAFTQTLFFHAWQRGERSYPMTDAHLIKLYKSDLARPLRQGEEREKAGLFGEQDVHQRREPGGVLNPAFKQLTEQIKKTTGYTEDWKTEHNKLYTFDDQVTVYACRLTHREIEAMLTGLLAAQIKRQSDALRDAHASKQVALANKQLEQGHAEQAAKHIRLALRIQPEHVPAKALMLVIEAMSPTKKEDAADE